MVGEIDTHEDALDPEMVVYTLLWNTCDSAMTYTWGA
jgi:hypothetical protein